MLRREICSLKDNGQGVFYPDAGQHADLAELKANSNVGSAAVGDDGDLLSQSSGVHPRSFATRSEVQEMIDEAPRFQIPQIAGTLRELLADALP